MKKNSGFTIIEMLIIVIVIALLATIGVVSYSAAQMRARDTERKNDLASLRDSLQIYYSKYGNYLETASGCGTSNNGEGWVSQATGGSYSNSIVNCLKTAGYLNSDIVDPSGCINNLPAPKCSSPTKAYMKANCYNGTTNTKFVYLFARLEQLGTVAIPSEASADCTNAATWYSTYGFNYAVRVE
ncbi:MAG: prepilin-type N-terminal cleavage/methylation domain-containing protein [Candidatus Saccharimonadaceae bacterium]